MTSVTITANQVLREMSGLSLGRSAGVNIKVPDTLDSAQIETALRDLELLGASLRQNPDAINAILKAGGQGDFATARSLARENKLLEEDFVANGGGLWLAVAIGVGLLLYSQHAH